MSQDKIKVLTRKDLSAPVNPTSINPATNELSEQSFSAVKMSRINWLWDQRIARGKVTLFAGEPGKGKSQLLLWIAAGCTNGSPMPANGSSMPQGKVAILASEDDDDDTMLPRLMAVKANLANVFQLKSTPKYDQNGHLQDDMVRLDQDMQKLDNTFTKSPGYVLLIIDPITAYIGDINDYKNSEVRTLIAKLSRIAKKHNLAIILNTHLTKPSGNPQMSSIINRVTGSLAYAAAARSVYLICDDPDDAQFKLFLPIKNNLGVDTGGYKYRVCPTTIENNGEKYETCRIEWSNEMVDLSANEAMVKERPAPKRDEAIEFLKSCLKNGSCLVRDVRQLADENNINSYNLYEAKKALKVIEDYTLDRPRLTTWTLPSSL